VERNGGGAGGGDVRQQPPDANRPGERSRFDSRITQYVHAIVTAVDELKHTGWGADRVERLKGDFGFRTRKLRVARMGLHNDRAAGRENRSGVAAEHRKREREV